MPIFGTAFIGLSNIAATVSCATWPRTIIPADLFHQLPITAYMVDAFPEYASSANAAATVIRSTLGALIPLAGPSMYATLGIGWGNTLLALVAFASLPIPFVLIKYGQAIRTNPKYQVKL